MDGYYSVTQRLASTVRLWQGEHGVLCKQSVTRTKMAVLPIVANEHNSDEELSSDVSGGS